jgi:hypothetical protein
MTYITLLPSTRFLTRCRKRKSWSECRPSWTKSLRWPRVSGGTRKLPSKAVSTRNIFPSLTAMLMRSYLTVRDPGDQLRLIVSIKSDNKLLSVPTSMLVARAEREAKAGGDQSQFARFTSCIENTLDLASTLLPGYQVTATLSEWCADGLPLPSFCLLCHVCSQGCLRPIWRLCR